MVAAIVTSRTRASYLLPPGGPVVCNAASDLARGLVGWWPLNDPNPAVRMLDLSPNAVQYPATVNGTAGVNGTPFGGTGYANTGSTSNYLLTSATPLTGVVISMAAWFQPVAVSAAYNLMVNGGSASGADYHNLSVTAANAVIAGSAQNGTGAEADATSTTTFTAGVPMLAVGAWASATSRTAYCFNFAGLAGGKGTNTTSRTPASIVQISLGAFHTAGGTFSPINGVMWNACMWNYTLSDTQAYRLADPRWRWDLYYVLGQRTFSFAPAAPGGSAAPIGAFAIGANASPSFGRA